MSETDQPGSSWPRTPADTGHRRKGRLRNRLLVVLGVLALLAAGTAGALIWYGDRQIKPVDVDTAIPGDTDSDGAVDQPELKDLRNVLLVGSDSRAGLTDRERKALGTGSFSGTRTDTIMLVQLEPRGDTAAMLSFPRDLLVTRCDGSQGRINGAFEIGEANGVGGPNCLVQTVTEETGIPVHHYVQIDFEGFVDIVDTLGGVQMCLREPIVDAAANVDLGTGCQRLSGAEALGFARVRKIDSDFGRIARQQRLIRAIVRQTSSARVAADVPRLFRLARAVGGAVETDARLSIGAMRQIAYSFRGLDGGGVVSHVVPATDQMIDGVAYVVADAEEAEDLFSAFRRGKAAAIPDDTES